MPDKLFFQQAGEWLSLHSSNLQLPLLGSGSVLFHPKICLAISSMGQWVAGERNLDIEHVETLGCLCPFCGAKVLCPFSFITFITTIGSVR